MKNFKTQGIIVLVVLAMFASFIVPATYSVARAQEANKEILAQDHLNPISETELPEELTFEQLESFAYFFQEIKETPEFQEEIRKEIPQKLARGKATVTAKIAAKAIKATLKKLGQKKYEQLLKTSGIAFAWLNWKSIHSIIDFLANSGEQIQTALEKQLVKYGANKTVAYWVAKTLVFILF